MQTPWIFLNLKHKIAYIYIYICVCVCVCVRFCIIYICTHTHTHTNIYIWRNKYICCGVQWRNYRRKDKILSVYTVGTCGNEGYIHLFLDPPLHVNEWSALLPLSLFSQGKLPCYVLSRRLCWTDSRFGRFRETRNLLPLPKIPLPFPINSACGGEIIYPCVHMFGFQSLSPFESLSFEDISLLHILSFVIHVLWNVWDRMGDIIFQKRNNKRYEVGACL